MGLLTAAQMIAVINHVIVGLIVVIAFNWVTGAKAISSIVVGIIVSILVALLDVKMEESNWNDYVASFEVRFPMPPEGTLSASE